MFSVVAIPDENISKSDNSGTCLVHMLINPIFVSRAAGFARQKDSKDKRRQPGEEEHGRHWGRSCIQGLAVFQEFAAFLPSSRTEGR